MENATEKFREGRQNFREDIKLFIGLPKQPLLGLSPPVKIAGLFYNRNPIMKCMFISKTIPPESRPPFRDE